MILAIIGDLMSDGNGKRTLIDALKACGAVKFGDFTLASGKKSSYYIDIKKASTDPKTLKVIAKEAGKVIKGLDIDSVGGVVLGGVPLATAVSMETDLPLILIRKSAKEYGTGGRFVGDFQKGSKVLLLEDVTTSGGSVMDAIVAIREAGAVVDRVITVVDRESGAEKSLSDIGVKLVPLVRASDLI
ncbi:orotate phosphoribosyltransferase [Methanolobus vulcani]|jgi:orotate phosphoribosyltransferase|uniref:Orotate phosphoribosyltransferase n=1 Tax=Methanolobus vulcani TaxID=38026 RepID=A0A7Z7AVL1_9EURY|nr:orotate phosphoribosyltransferase [Methanolobus vulcani]MDK2825718.1 orotate phosphoribosyltransferase [Methanolobus sp.]SDF63806.1 orotate phosphoribosyltransferase [Methanolobus vulcani]